MMARAAPKLRWIRWHGHEPCHHTACPLNIHTALAITRAGTSCHAGKARQLPADQAIHSLAIC